MLQICKDGTLRCLSFLAVFQLCVYVRRGAAIGALSRMKAPPPTRSGSGSSSLGKLIERQGSIPGLSDILDTVPTPKTKKNRRGVFPGPCIRVSNRKNFGFGLNPHNGHVYVDVGNCTKMTNSFGNFSESSSGRLDAHCKKRQSCVPIKTREQTVYSLRGPLKVVVAVKCGCAPQASQKTCQRVPQKRTFFAKTKFETTLDVGQCQGLCQRQNSSSQCVAIVKRCVIIRGPNGKQCVDVVRRCACQPSCHRLQHNEAFREVIFNKAENKTTFHTKVVDVGRCSGKCPRLSRTDYCKTLLEPNLRALCRWGGHTKHLYCVPSVVKDQTIQTDTNKHTTVTSIVSCSCQGG